MKNFFKKRKKVLAFCKKVLYTNEVGCGKQQKSRANDTNEYGQLVKGLRRRPLTAETDVYKRQASRPSRTEILPAS